MLKSSRAWAVALATLLLSPVAALPTLEAEGVVAGESPAATAASWTLADRLVVGYASPDAAAALARLAPALDARIVRVDEALRFMVVQTDPARQAEVAKAMLRVDGVAYAKPDARIEGFFTPNDPRYGEQWGPAPIGVPAAWNLTRGSHNVTVAVIDTGVDGAHPDLAANFCVDGWDYVNGDASSADDHGHGTHVAGTVAAAIHNGVGVAGMADACIMAVKVLDQYGGGSFADLASSLVWATDHGADVISMSLGGCGGCDPGSPTTEAIQYAHASGVLIVAAAGNAYCSPVSYPAAYPEAIAVAALAPPGNDRASFSSCGAEVEVAAPGQDILSTSLTSGPLSDPSGYMSLSGTSMATPHVSGVAALAWSHRPSLTSEEVRCILAQTADDLGAVGRDAGTGFGRIDAAAAMTAACEPLPPLPGQIAARARNASVQLSWSPATSFGTNLTGYNLYRGESGGPLALLASLGDVRSYRDENVTNGVTYRYAVSGVNAHGEGNLSNVVEATPAASQPFACDVANDAYGNACASATYRFIDVQATGTELPQADDALFQVALPFAFRFYGRDYTTLNVSTNGFLNFFDGTTSGCCSPQPIPSPDAPNALVAGLWADLLPVQARAITTEVVGLPGSRIAVIQFTNVPFYAGTAARLTFQFQLHEGTNVIEVHYQDADPMGEREYGAGIESCDGQDGIQAKMGYEALVETAVRYTPGSGSPPACAANTPPAVAILTPEDGATVSGVVNVTGTATDADAGDAIEYVSAYYYNATHGETIPVSGTTAWSGSFSTSGLSGWYTLVAYASDGSSYGYAQDVTFHVAAGNVTVPRAVIASPSDGQTVRGVVEVNGTASDEDGDAVTHVTLQVDDGEERVVEGASSWRTLVDFSALAPGEHVLRARATGDDGTGPAHVIRVFVESVGNAAPQTAITTPAPGATVGRYAYVAGTAHDPDWNDTVESVWVSVDGGPEFLAAGTTAWDLVLDMGPYGEGVHEIRARASDGDVLGRAASAVVFVDFEDSAADLSVTSADVVIERQRITTDFGDAPNVVNEERVVRVTVRNLGTAATNGWLDVLVEGETRAPLAGPTARRLGSAWLDRVPENGSVTLEFAWDTTLAAGDVTLVVRVTAGDHNPANDEARKDAWVRVGGINHGAVL